jgi:putrescine transport system substrate-binding protein
VTQLYRIIASTALFLLVSCGGDSSVDSEAENVVNFYAWSDYVAPDTIEKFEAEFGVKVNMDVYAAGSVVDVKLLTGNSGYDVVIHSNQYSSRLAPIGIYEKLDMSRIPNIKHLDAEIWERINVFEAVEGYMVPYFWGSTGYSWNEEMVRERLPDHPMDSMDVLFDPDVISKVADCGVALIDDPTDLFPMMLAYLGRDPNAVDDESLAAAEAQFAKIRPYVRYFSNDKMLVDMPNKEICVYMSWSGDYAAAAARARQANIDISIRYTVPKEGSGLWVDGVYIPADAKHKDNAYKLINFLMRPDIAADLTNEVQYANANRSSWEFIRPEIMNDPGIYPDSDVWERIYRVNPIEPKRERPRTRAFARVKSGI